MQDLDGKVAVVTGGGSGIGAAIARACADAGMAVAVVDIDESRARETAVAITNAGGRAEAYAVDVRDPDALADLADRVFDTFRGCHLLCNNAGVCPLGSAWDHSFAEWQNTVAINVFGVVNGINAFAPRMIAQAEEAHIVNTASAAALVYVPASALYNTTKAAVLSLTESLRGDLAPFGIGVSALCPGGVITNIGDTAAGTVGTPHSPAQLEEAFTQLRDGVDDAHVTVIEPDDVGALVLEGVRENAPYIITHPGSQARATERAEQIDRAYTNQRARHPELP